MGNHAGPYGMFRRADLAKERALGRRAFPLQDIAAAAGRIAMSVHDWNLIFHPGIELVIVGPQLQAAFGDGAQTAPFGSLPASCAASRPE